MPLGHDDREVLANRGKDTGQLVRVCIVPVCVYFVTREAPSRPPAGTVPLTFLLYTVRSEEIR